MIHIDYIWSDVNWSFDILGCDIKDAHLITDSDHNIVTSHFNTSNIIRNHKIFKCTIEKTIPYEEKCIVSLQTEDLKKIERRNYIHYAQLKDIKHLKRIIAIGKRNL